MKKLRYQCVSVRMKRNYKDLRQDLYWRHQSLETGMQYPGLKEVEGETSSKIPFVLASTESLGFLPQ